MTQIATIETSGPAQAHLAHVWPSRTFASWTFDRKADTEPKHLEEVRDLAKVVREELQPEELERSLGQWMFSYGDGHSKRSTMAPLMPAGGMGEPYELTHNGYGQLLTKTLPGHAGRTLDFLRSMGEQGTKVAGLVVNMGLRKQTQASLVRSILYEGSRVVRSIHSQRYACYDDIHFLEDLLACEDICSLQVLDYRLTDTAFRIRFALDGLAEDPTHPSRILEAWNSETGNRAVWLEGGVWKEICTNGLKAWVKEALFRWSHIGDTERIRTGVRSAMQDIRVAIDGTLEAYSAAMDTAIDDAAAWMLQELAGMGMSQERSTRAVQALDDPTTTPGRLLASTVDAVTLAAQGEDDLLAQHDMEVMAGQLLQAGLGQSQDYASPLGGGPEARRIRFRAVGPEARRGL